MGAAAAATPTPKPKTGRPAVGHRRLLNGLLWILRTGAPWRDLPEPYGPWRTVTSRFYRWRNAGVFQHMFDALKQQADAAGQLDWQIHDVDSTILRAHRHAAGANKGLRNPKHEAAARVASVPKCICEQKAAASG